MRLAPRKRRTRSCWWNQDIRLIEKKLGILGTRGGATTAIGWVVGIAVTPWLRWFVSGSLLLGLLLATAFQYLYNHEPPPPDILKPED